MENFFFVQSVTVRVRMIEENPPGYGVIRSVHRQATLQHGRVANSVAALSSDDARGNISALFAARRARKPARSRETALVRKTRAENERPVRGDNRTGQAVWGAWGGWALAPDTAFSGDVALPQS